MIILHFDLPPQFTYELFHIRLTPFHPSREIWTQQIDLAPNVWLHSSVGRASHRYCGGHGFESRWGPDFFQASSFQLLKLENLLRWSFFTLIYDRSSIIWIIFIYTSHHFTPHGRYELNKLTSLPMCGFIAQLVEHRTGIAEVTGSNPVEALIFFRLLLSNCLNWNIYCDDHSSLSSTSEEQIWIISYKLHIISLHGKIWTQ